MFYWIIADVSQLFNRLRLQISSELLAQINFPRVCFPRRLIECSDENLFLTSFYLSLVLILSLFLTRFADLNEISGKINWIDCDDDLRIFMLSPKNSTRYAETFISENNFDASNANSFGKYWKILFSLLYEEVDANWTFYFQPHRFFIRKTLRVFWFWLKFNSFANIWSPANLGNEFDFDRFWSPENWGLLISAELN